MSLSPAGTLFVGTRKDDKVYAVQDTNRDGKADRTFIVARGLNVPNGVAFSNGHLYVAEINRILRYDNIESHLATPPKPVVVYDELPTEHHHGWKFIRFGPDGNLYVPIGAPCNICDEPGYARITRMNPDGTRYEPFALGVRNTVGFDWHPDTGELWFTDNGRDLMGDDIPPDELNHAPRKDMHFGYPYCHGRNIPDPAFGRSHACAEFTPPAQELGPHVASLGMRFYTGTQFPDEYTHQIFIAEHGSWNRSNKIGYQISLVRLKNNKVVSYKPFATGWLQGQFAWGRPVDIEIMQDGAMLVSDDRAGVIYRIAYQP